MKTLLILILILGFVVVANAQNAILAGTVYDENGSVIVGATVKIKSENGKSYQSVTNEEGNYQFRVAANIYSIEIIAKHFEIFRINKYKVAPLAKGKQILDVVLTVGETPAGIYKVK